MMTDAAFPVFGLQIYDARRKTQHSTIQVPDLKNARTNTLHNFKTFPKTPIAAAATAIPQTTHTFILIIALCK